MTFTDEQKALTADLQHRYWNDAFLQRGGRDTIAGDELLWAYEQGVRIFTPCADGLPRELGPGEAGKLPEGARIQVITTYRHRDLRPLRRVRRRGLAAPRQPERLEGRSMTLLLAIDPGPAESAYVLIDAEVSR